MKAEEVPETWIDTACDVYQVFKKADTGFVSELMRQIVSELYPQVRSYVIKDLWQGSISIEDLAEAMNTTCEEMQRQLDESVLLTREELETVLEGVREHDWR